MDSHTEDDGGWGIWIVVLIVVLLIIGIIVWWCFTKGTTTGGIYTFTGSGSTSQSITPENMSIFTATPASAGMTLTVVPPVDPIGKSFIVDNTGGTGIVTISGVTVSNTVDIAQVPLLSSTKIRSKTTATFIWKSASELLRQS